MNPKQFCNIRISRKISLMHALLFLIVQIVLGSTLLITVRVYYSFEAIQEVKSVDNQISNNLKRYSGDISQKELSKSIPTNLGKYIVHISITNIDRNIKITYGNASVRNDVGELYYQCIREKVNGRSLVYYNDKVSISGEDTYILQIVGDLTKYLEFNSTLFRVLLLLTILGFVISIFTGVIVSRVILKPLAKIIKTTHSIDSNCLDVRIETNNTKDELYELSEEINSMIVRLQDSFDKQEQLIWDVSHELKTPISIIKGYSDLLNRWGKQEPVVLNESIQRISREADNMSNIVENLLLLARKDNGSLCVDRVAFDVIDLIQEVMEEVNTLNAECDIAITRCDRLQYVADYGLMKQMLRIIVDNSIKYSETICRIRISVENRNTHMVLSIEDSGIGIAKNDLNKVFDRFYRADKARSRNTGGTGLGLSIAKTIVESHNGTISVESELGKGTTFILTFPREEL